MANANEKLASSLDVLRDLQAGGRRVFRFGELSRTHRARLLERGFLQPVIKGWYMSSSPEAAPGDTTPWFASFWEFCARYCDDRFGDAWHLSAEQSLKLHAENTEVPEQLIVMSPRANNNNMQLLFGSSLFDLSVSSLAPDKDVTLLSFARGLRGYTAAAALTKVSEAFFRLSAIDARSALSTVELSALLAPLLEQGQTTVAGRLAGALRRVERGAAADEVLQAMHSAGHRVRETDPFDEAVSMGALGPQASPAAGRIRGLWQQCRQSVIDTFPASPGLPDDSVNYLARVDDVYKQDAYHSLSIEGYAVTPELIDRVRVGSWNAADSTQDRQIRDALAARGYWGAFQKVRESAGAIIGGCDATAEVERGHRLWYRELFAPCVTAGLVPAASLAGYRRHPVYLQGSRHVPPRFEIVSDSMAALFECMRGEPEASVRAVLGHWLVGYIHPYPDGNGRVARFVMNAMLASGGYPWLVVRMEQREQYMAALEVASVELNVGSFAQLLGESLDMPGQ